MKPKPILFSGPMVRALLEGRKTQTRRILKPQPPEGSRYSGIHYASYEPDTHFFGTPHGGFKVKQRYWEDDVLWVRETWQALSFGDYMPTRHHVSDVRYAATDPLGSSSKDIRGYDWRPSIFMPRWASRMTLVVTDVRVQRLQDISEEDARAEGMTCEGHPNIWRPYGTNWPAATSARAAMLQIWNHINGAESWDANPWVVALTVTVHQYNVDEFLKQREAA
jgi:hypothetical protein